MKGRIWLGLCAVALAAPLLGAGTAVGGSDRAVLLIPPGVEAEAYENAGYRLALNDGVVTVDVDLSPLASRAPFALPPAPKHPENPEIDRLARALATGARTQHEAVSRLLAWVARAIEYDLDRQASQEASAVLARRRAYCTGLARLSVALLEAVGLPAREVPGWVAAERGGEFHRWIEVYYPDRGWVFSDPLRSHHFVPATYVRLAAEALDAGAGDTGVLLARENRLVPVDSYPVAPEAILARRNDSIRQSGVLRVRVERSTGAVVLRGGGSQRSLAVEGGGADFVGVAPGEYRLEWLVGQRVTAAKRVVLHGPVEAEVRLAERRGKSGEGESR